MLTVWDYELEGAMTGTEKYIEWRNDNLDHRRKLEQGYSQAYRERQLESNPEEYMDRRRASIRKYAKKKYDEFKENATDEEKAAYREKKAAYMKEYRAKKKAEKEAKNEN